MPSLEQKASLPAATLPDLLQKASVLQQRLEANDEIEDERIRTSRRDQLLEAHDELWDEIREILSSHRTLNR